MHTVLGLNRHNLYSIVIANEIQVTYKLCSIRLTYMAQFFYLLYVPWQTVCIPKKKKDFICNFRHWHNLFKGFQLFYTSDNIFMSHTFSVHIPSIRNCVYRQNGSLRLSCLHINKRYSVDLYRLPEYIETYHEISVKTSAFKSVHTIKAWKQKDGTVKVYLNTIIKNKISNM